MIEIHVDDIWRWCSEELNIYDGDVASKHWGKTKLKIYLEERENWTFWYYGWSYGWFSYVWLYECIGLPSMPKREIVARKCYIIILSMMSNLLTIGEMTSNLLFDRRDNCLLINSIICNDWWRIFDKKR